MKFILILSCLLVSPLYVFGLSEQDEKFEFSFPESIRVGGQSLELRLSGKTRFRYWGFLVYEVALYSEKRDSTQLFKQHFALQIAYYRSISADEFKQSAKSVLKQGQLHSYEKVRGSFETWSNFIEPVKREDRYTIVYSPDGELSLDLNGASIGSVRDRGFAQAYTGIWLAENSVLGKRREDLLVGFSPNLKSLNYE